MLFLLWIDEHALILEEERKKSHGELKSQEDNLAALKGTGDSDVCIALC